MQIEQGIDRLELFIINYVIRKKRRKEKGILSSSEAKK